MTTAEKIAKRLPDLEILCRVIGNDKWVVCRRTARMIRYYGEGVKCLSRKQYNEAVNQALRQMMENL